MNDTVELLDLLEGMSQSVLQDAAFVFVEPAEEPYPEWTDTVLEAAIDYCGPGEGELHLMASSGFARGLAANMLGLEPDDPEVESQGPDALAEMLNTICGAFVAEAFGTDVVCDLGIPAVSEITPESVERRHSVAALSLVYMTDEEQRLDLTLSLMMG